MLKFFNHLFNKAPSIGTIDQNWGCPTKNINVKFLGDKKIVINLICDYAENNQIRQLGCLFTSKKLFMLKDSENKNIIIAKLFDNLGINLEDTQAFIIVCNLDEDNWKAPVDNAMTTISGHLNNRSCFLVGVSQTLISEEKENDYYTFKRDYPNNPFHQSTHLLRLDEVNNLRNDLDTIITHTAGYPVEREDFNQIIRKRAVI